MSPPRGIRNRNPGNIVDAPWTRQQSGYAAPLTGSSDYEIER